MPGQSANGLGSVTAWTSTFYGRLYDPVVTKTISNNTLTVTVNETFRTENAAGQASSPVNYQPTYRVLYKKTVSSGGTLSDMKFVGGTLYGEWSLNNVTIGSIFAVDATESGNVTWLENRTKTGLRRLSTVTSNYFMFWECTSTTITFNSIGTSWDYLLISPE